MRARDAFDDPSIFGVKSASSVKFSCGCETRRRANNAHKPARKHRTDATNLSSAVANPVSQASALIYDQIRSLQNTSITPR